MTISLQKTRDHTEVTENLLIWANFEEIDMLNVCLQTEANSCQINYREQFYHDICDLGYQAFNYC